LRKKEIAAGVHRVGNSVGARKEPEQAVEAPVLLIDHDDVVDSLQGFLSRVAFV
jgi:hypothetical protein